MIFATDFRSLSKSFLLVALASAAHGFAADSTKREPEKLAKMPTMYECINGDHQLFKNGFAFYSNQLKDACEDATKKQDVLNAHKALGNITIIMNVPLVRAWSSENKKEANAYGKLEEFASAFKEWSRTQKKVDSEEWSKPERETVEGFCEVHHNINFERIFYMVGGYTAEKAALKALAECSQKAESNLLASAKLTTSAASVAGDFTGVGGDHATVLPPCMANYNLYVEATKAVASEVELLLTNENKSKLKGECADMLTLAAQTIIDGLKKAVDKSKINEDEKVLSEEILKKQKIYTILSSALIDKLEKRGDATLKAENSRLEKQKTELEVKLRQQTEEAVKSQTKFNDDIGILRKKLQAIDEIKDAERHEATKVLKGEVEALTQKIKSLGDASTKVPTLEKQLEEKTTLHNTNLRALQKVTDEKKQLLADATNYNKKVAALSQQLTTLQQELDTFKNKKTGNPDCPTGEPNKTGNPNQKTIEDATADQTTIILLNRDLKDLQQQLAVKTQTGTTGEKDKTGHPDPKPKSWSRFLPNRSFLGGNLTGIFGAIGTICVYKLGWLAALLKFLPFAAA